MPGALAAIVLLLCAPQVPHTPDVAAQRAAMKKLGFLTGEWSGTARIFRSADQPLELVQTEHAQYVLDGLLLQIEGTGRSKGDGQAALQAFGIISYDDEARTYRFRAFNDGRWLESDVKLADNGRGISWGFSLGDIHTSSVLRIDANGHWTEQHQIAIGAQPPRRFIEVDVSKTGR